ncbi:hypothetical protein IJX73_01260 [bacterium]|nr:hypothetical protein [bacterium]
MKELVSKINKNIYLKIALVVAILLLFVFIALSVSIKYFMSYSLIENKVFELTGLKLEFVEPESTFDYRLNLNTKAKKIDVYDSTKKTKFITIQNPDITFKPLGFLFKRAYFKKVSADGVLVDVKRNAKGEIDLISALNKDVAAFLDNEKINLTRLNLEIPSIQFLFNDDYQIKSSTKIDLKDNVVDISKRKKKFSFSQNGKIETSLSDIKQVANLAVKIDSKYPINNFKETGLNLDVKLDNIDLFIFNDLAKKYISNNIAFLKGDVQLELKTQESDKNYHNLKIKFKKPTLKLNDGKTVSPFDSGLNADIAFGINKDEVDIKKIKLNANKLSFLANGKILKPFSKKPDYDFDLKIADTELNNLIHFIPDNAIYYRPKGIPTLKKSNFHAELNGDLKLKLFPLNIVGNLKAQNVYIPKYPKTYRQNDVNARFMGDKVRIFTRVYTPDNEYVTVDGISNLDNSLYGKYSVKSTSKIDLAFAQLYLVPIQQIIGFNIGPVPIMNITGYGNINIDTKGTLSDAQIFGEFSANNATATIDGLDAKLTNGNCKLIFDDKNLIFKEIKGKLDGADFILAGIGNTKGEVKLNAKISDAKTNKILKIFNNSVISEPYRVLTSDVSSATGDLEADINLVGTIKDYEDKTFLKTLMPSGRISIKDNNIVLNNGLEINKALGFLNFGNNQNGKVEFLLNNSLVNFEFSSKDSIEKISKNQKISIDSQVFSNKFAFLDVINFVKNADFLNAVQKNIVSEFDDVNFYSKFFIKSSGVLSLDNMNFLNLKHNGYIIGLNSSEIKDFKFDSGIVKLNNDKIVFDNVSANIKNGNLKIKGAISNISQAKPFGDLVVNIKDIDLDKLDKILPKIKSANGIIKNGQIALKGYDLKLNSISLDWGSTPIFINAKIKDVYSSRYLESDFTTIIDEISSDNIINPYLITPVKIVGEVPIKGSFRGNQDNYFVDFSALVPKNSDISFGGANLGDINYKRELSGRVSVLDNIASINNLKLTKFISNQNNKVNPVTALKVNGKIIQNDESMSFDDLKIISYTPINVRILNLIFKKSLLKNGNFDCNISLNGDVKLPKINGRFNLYDLDIPLYDTQINNIKISISNKFIDGEIFAKNQLSDAKLNFHAVNKLSAPYIVRDFILVSNKLDILGVLNSLTPTAHKTDIVPKQEIAIKPRDIIIEKGSFDFKEVNYDKITMQNLKGNLNYKDEIANLSNVIVDIAQGKILASGKYDVGTTQLDINAKMGDCDSNILAHDFLGLSNQIYGKMNGNLTLSGKSLNTPQGIKNIASEIDFSINNGKMPKLGSLEYLLRAGNLFKNGILGLSLNNIIEVLTPYKTGEFEKISGNLKINNGEIENLNILSQGKNLSMYLDGNYSILENFADIKIYGKLSQSISNALGALGNASISQVVDVITQAKRNRNEKNEELQEKLDKIPSIEIENPEPRFFKAKVLGDINKENYIKSFDWI